MSMRFALALLAAQLVSAAVTYSYDAAGRLAKVDYGSAGSIVYTYDAAGNLTSRTVQAPGSNNVKDSTSNKTKEKPAPASKKDKKQDSPRS